ncbi:hypothetical protein [Hansschlegelia zhihuaiae]|uniref:Uncharacterized protein n=1 Tax=Hansschlegelia zhihuaiae TaxID=405005 RepID=A0A4Q0MPH9_9HYPH|nr:hypothetical protein [Hansschlegelia zhihuaiae]RXF75049.1 hypothetical protein EK403_03100 [Hansschlegelia zhihuaiae]
MIHVSTRPGPVSRINTAIVGDVVVASFVCASPEAAAAVMSSIDARLAEQSFDFSPVGELPEPDPFPAGSPVGVRVHAWDEGEMSIDAVVLRRISDDRLEVRTRMGRIERVHQRDLRARPVQ